MKYISELIDIAGKSYLKKILILIAVVFILLFFQVYRSSSSSITFMKMTLASSTFYLSYIGLFVLILFFMHKRRFKKVIQEGSFNRIRLLPIPKMSLVYSELLFVGFSYALLFCAVGLAWILGNALAHTWDLKFLFLVTTGNEVMKGLAPFTIINFCKTLLMFGMLTYVTVLILMASADTDTKITVYIVLIIYFFISMIINNVTASQAYQRTPYYVTNIAQIVELLGIILYSNYKLYKLFKRKGRAS
ncbi:MAG: hypothetical protein RR690_01710 [Longicatena sp.]